MTTHICKPIYYGFIMQSNGRRVGAGAQERTGQLSISNYLHISLDGWAFIVLHQHTLLYTFYTVHDTRVARRDGGAHGVGGVSEM